MEVLLCLAGAAWLWGSINEVQIRIETECMYCESSVDIKVHNTAHVCKHYMQCWAEREVWQAVCAHHTSCYSLSLSPMMNSIV